MSRSITNTERGEAVHIIETGNVAAALGVKLAGVQVVAAYPITP